MTSSSPSSSSNCSSSPCTVLSSSPPGSSASHPSRRRGAGSLKGPGPLSHIHPLTPRPTGQNSAHLTSRPWETQGLSSCGPIGKLVQNTFLESLQGTGLHARVAGLHGVHECRGLWSPVEFTGNRFTGRAGSGTRGPGPARSPLYPNIPSRPCQRLLGAASGSHPQHHGLKEDRASAACTWETRAQPCLG